MLHPFVSAPSAPSPSRTVSTPVLALVASLHLGLFFAALTSTKEVQYTQKPEAEAVPEKVQFVELPFSGVVPRPAPRTAPSAAPRSRGKVRSARRVSADLSSRMPQLIAVDLELPPAPMPDVQPQFAAFELGGGVNIGDDLLHLGVGEARSPMSASGRYNAYEESVVEKRALAVTDNPKPRYPGRMLNRGIESNFNVYFVVDTSGVVDRETLELPPSVQEDFTRAVLDVLFRWHFVPAEMGGRRVRQRVLQPFIFRLERRFGSIARP